MERIYELRQFYNEIAYCLTPYHMEYFQKLIKKTYIKLQSKQLDGNQNKYSFRTKFKFKTLHLNKTQNNIEKQKVDEKSKKLSFQLESTKNVEDKEIVLSQAKVKDHYKLENLKNCKVRIEAVLKTLYLENIENCEIYTGIVETSIFGQNISQSKISCIAQQIRIHKSSSTEFNIFVTSNMILEDSKDISVRQLAPTQIPTENFNRTFFADRRNNWKQVKDFNWIKHTPSPNFKLIESG